MGQAGTIWHTPYGIPPKNIIMSDLEVNKKIPKHSGFRSVLLPLFLSVFVLGAQSPPAPPLAAVIPFLESAWSVQGSQPLSPQSTRPDL